MLGALSIDSAQAWSRKQDESKESGQSWRIRYSKNIIETGTNFSIAGYRYSTSGYYSLSEVLDTWRDNDWKSQNDRRRNRAELQLNQNISQNLGSLTLNMMSEDYWNSERKMRSISVGYSNNWAGVTYNLNYSYNENTTDTDNKKVYDKDQIFSFNINVPFDLWSGNNYATYSLNTSKHGSTSHNLGMNGSTLADNNLNWNIQQSQTNHGEGNGGYASLDYQGTYARVNSAYSYDRDQRRVNYGIDG